MIKSNRLYFFFFTLLISISSIAQSNIDRPYVVVLSLDGFRWDYTNYVKTPNFDKLAQIGVKAQSLQPSFPSKTFPNHYTMATGLFPGNHGLVNNSYYHPEKKNTYKISNRKTVEDKDFYGGEPIWNTAEKQGVKSACFYWVGSEAPVQNMRPSIWKKYDHDFPWKARMDSVISWLTLPKEQRPHLIMWYLPEPDGVGHKYGPMGMEARAMVKRLDKYIGSFLKKLEQLPHYSKINFIVTSDHGMGETSSERTVDLSKYTSKKDFEYMLTGNPVVFIQPKKTKLDKVYDQLKDVEHINVTKNGERPAHWHYNYNKRIADLVIVADSAWSVGWGIKSYGQQRTGGTHGYDPQNIDMHAIFYAAGPAFKQRYIQPTFENVDIYNIIAHILNLKPAPNNGNFERVKEMLRCSL